VLWKAISNYYIQRAAFESENKIFRRSLNFISDLKKGDYIQKRMSKEFELVMVHLINIMIVPLKKNLKIRVEFGDPVNLENIEINYFNYLNLIKEILLKNIKVC